MGGWNYTIILRGSDRVLLVVGLVLAVVVGWMELVLVMGCVRG